MKKIYLASPLFSEAERTFNSTLTGTLRTMGFEVFLPQESEVNNNTIFDPQSIFENDIENITSADFIVAVIEGMEIDAGVCFEIGYAYALGKKVYAVRTDNRGTNDIIVNLMITRSCLKIFSDTEKLVFHLGHLVASSCES